MGAHSNSNSGDVNNGAEQPTKQKYYPYMGFAFAVTFVNFEGKGDLPVSFQSVDGLKMSTSPEGFRDTGNFNYQYSLPMPVTYGPLTLKKGMMNDMKLFNYFQKAFDTMRVTPMDIKIDLLPLNSGNRPEMSWIVHNATPTSWDISGFSADSSSIVMESMTFNYTHFTVMVNGKLLMADD